MARTRQPQGAVRANPEWAPSALWSFATPVDCVSNALVTLGSGASKVILPVGQALQVVGRTDADRAVLNVAPNADNIGSGDFTAFTRFVLLSGSGDQTGYTAIGRWYSGGGGLTQSDWFLGAGSGFDNSTVDFTCAIGSNSLPCQIAATSWTYGNEYSLFGRRTETTLAVFRYNHTTKVWDAASTTDAGLTTVNYTSARKLSIGEIAFSSGYNADLQTPVAALFKRALSNAQLEQIVANPWQLFAPQRRLWIQLGAAAGGTTAYTIDAQPGGYSISGTAATLARGLFIDAQPATYTVSGTAATIVRGYNLDAQPGTYTATGTAASLLRGYTVDASPGSFSLTGVAATLDKVTPGVYTLDAQPGSYSLTGIAATLTYTPLNVYTLDAQPGAYVVTGAAAGLTYTGSSIWTDIGVSATTWSDIGGATSIWTDL